MSKPIIFAEAARDEVLHVAGNGLELTVGEVERVAAKLEAIAADDEDEEAAFMRQDGAHLLRVLGEALLLHARGEQPASPASEAGELDFALRSALRFAASRSAITAEQERAILAALSPPSSESDASVELRKALGEAYETLSRIEQASDCQISRAAAKNAASRIETALAKLEQGGAGDAE